ncbi:Thiol peroxidase, Tpx-type [hydrothermal vent metagenome]|uniref:Thiol peroxidase, Tpx-type n=1 Tax=hydrothermal vent metagenome TaxID=652676 RepID=A0A3B1E053_9ZZZZ
MATTNLKGESFNTSGDLPSVGSDAPGLSLTKTDLSEITCADLKGKQVILNIFPSVDTGVCADSVRRFNQEAANLENTVVLCISRDLPFALGRFCGAEGLDSVVPVSDFRTGNFGRDYGVQIEDGPLAGLLARSIVVVNTDGNVVYTELVPETTQEPNYEAALAALG